MSRLADALDLVAIDSQSGREATLAGGVERRLRAHDRLQGERVGDNVGARTPGSQADGGRVRGPPGARRRAAAVLTVVIYGAVTSAILAMLAVGFTLIFGVARILNLAHGAFYAIGAYCELRTPGLRSPR